MAKALAIITAIVGYNMAAKIYAIIKMMGLKIDNMNDDEIRDLLKDPRFRKYMR